MALKKFRFFVGACGPTILYSNIIRAEDEIAAAKQFLMEMGKELTDESIARQLQHIREIVPKENPEKLLDYMEKEISVDDEVVFIRNSYGKPPKLLTGKVEKITGKSIVIKTPSGESNKIMLPKDETEMLPRVIVTSPRPLRTVVGIIDATGYPLQEGDPVAYMGSVYAGTCEGFETGVVTKITAKTVVVGETRKSLEKVVVINW